MGNVNIAFVFRVLKTNVLENAGDVFIPKTSRFRMALEGMLNRENMRTVDLLVKLGLVPFGEGIIDAKEGGNARSRRVGKSVTSITSIDGILECGRQGSKETKAGLLNA
jgi:hypothetical protein